MTQEEKSLLLQDLCERLPYGVKIRIRNDYVRFQIEEHKLCAEHLANASYNIENLSMRSYLRPMSSMTEEEDKEWQLYKNSIACASDENLNERINDLYNWFNKRHLDYHGLIPKGLAIEAPKDMYNQR